jgi:hypothetical protein
LNANIDATASVPASLAVAASETSEAPSAGPLVVERAVDLVAPRSGVEAPAGEDFLERDFGEDNDDSLILAKRFDKPAHRGRVVRVPEDRLPTLSNRRKESSLQAPATLEPESNGASRGCVTTLGSRTWMLRVSACRDYRRWLIAS